MWRNLTTSELSNRPISAATSLGRESSRQLGCDLYHACHKEDLENILDEGKLGLRSKWSLKLPQHGEWSAPGTWVGLNYFRNGHYYGPFLLEFPLRVLDNRHFMVFRREGSDRKRYFFVQYEARIPIYSFEKKMWRNVNPRAYFRRLHGKKLQTQAGAIYDIVITQPISLGQVSIRPVGHPRCLSGTCNGTSIARNTRQLRKVASDQFRRWLSDNDEYGKLVRRFPVLAGVTVDLFDPERDD